MTVPAPGFSERNSAAINAEVPAAETEAHIGALDGLRAVAIALVLMFHFTPGHDSNQGIRALFFKVADLGWSGVDLFFVLSGFLITRKLIAARFDQHRFRDFYVRRALRIFPLSYAVLLLFLVIVPIVSTRIDLSPIDAQLPYWLYYSNFIQKPLTTDGLVIFGHFWSLAIEEQFYLLWPMVVFLTNDRRARRVCIALAGFPLALRLVLATNGAGWHPTFAWTPCRADGLAMGALLAFVYADNRLRRVALPWSISALALTTPLLAWVAWRDHAVLMMVDIFTPLAVVLRSVLLSVLAIFFAALLVVSLQVKPVARFLSTSPFRVIARYSYGIYVVHLMLLPLLMRIMEPSRLAHRFQSANLAAFVFFLCGTAISMAIAAISYHAFEAYFLSLKPLSPRQKQS
jgi:peptidoglycan/LPS O-acetylase OafA/YrhL